MQYSYESMFCFADSRRGDLRFDELEDVSSQRNNSQKATHTCPTCQKVFAQRQGLLRHQRTVHDGHRGYKCSTCGKAFLRQQQLDTHRLFVAMPWLWYSIPKPRTLLDPSKSL